MWLRTTGSEVRILPSSIIHSSNFVILRNKFFNLFRFFSIKLSNHNNSRETKIFSFIFFIKSIKKLKSVINKSVDNLCALKVNWRTTYKLSNYCSICGNNENIEYHHVKHIKIGKVSGFLQIMKQLNRKQILCCRDCHRKIQKGEYDDISLKDLYIDFNRKK